MALSATHDILNTTSWRGASLREVLESELKPYREPGAERVGLDGDRSTSTPRRRSRLA